MPELLIHDENWQEQIGDGKTIDFGGHARILNAIPPRFAYGDNPQAKPFEEAFTLIPESEWGDRIAEKDRDKAWLWDIVDGVIPASDQDSLGYCHAYGTVAALETARLVAGHPYVRLSAESVGGPVTGWRNQGADPSDDLAQIREVGACAHSFMDADWSLSPKRWKDGWIADCTNHKAVEWFDLAVPGHQFEAVVSAGLLGFGVGLGFQWWSHFVSQVGKVKAVKSNGRNIYDRWTYLFRNSWSASYGENGWAWLTGSKAVPDWAFAIRVATPSDA